MCPSECQSITHTHTHISHWHTLTLKRLFSTINTTQKKESLKSRNREFPRSSSHIFIFNFFPCGLYIRNVTKAFSGLESFIGSSLHWLAVYSVKSWYKYTFLLTEFIDKTFYVFASWTWDKSSIERPRLIPVYLTNTPLSDWR